MVLCTKFFRKPSDNIRNRKMNILYIRVSTEEESKQDPQQQIDAILDKFKLSDYKIFQERGSAYDLKKIHRRHEFFKILELCFDCNKTTVKDLFMSRLEKRNINLYVWDYSRIIRNIELNILFSLLSDWFGVKIVSYKDRSIMKDSDTKTPTEKMVKLMMNTISAFSAEEYSYTTGQNIKKSVDRSDKSSKVLKSKYGNKWGKSLRLLDGTISNFTPAYLEQIYSEIDDLIKYYQKRNMKTYFKNIIDKMGKDYGIIITKSFLSKRKRRLLENE